MQVIETALKLRKQYGTMLYALAIDIDHLANLIDFTGSSDRVISGKDRLLSSFNLGLSFGLKSVLAISKKQLQRNKIWPY